MCFLCIYTCAVKPYDTLNKKHALVMSVCSVMECTIFSLVTVKMTVKSYILTNAYGYNFLSTNSVHITT